MIVCVYGNVCFTVLHGKKRQARVEKASLFVRVFVSDIAKVAKQTLSIGGGSTRGIVFEV